MIRGESLPDGDFEVFFTNAECPHFSETCKVAASHTGQVITADLGRSALWHVLIEALRIDFPSTSIGRTTTLRSIELVTRDELDDLRWERGGAR